MVVLSTELSRTSTAETDLIDLTADVQKTIAESGVSSGTVTVFVPGSTASITTIEYESGALADLARTIEAIAPAGAVYEHNERWGDGNGYSHVRAALLGPSIAVPIIDGRAALGTWQQILLCDFDNRARTRRVIVQIVGK